VAAAGAGVRPAEAATEVLLRFARAGHGAGYPTADLEERVDALADALGLVGTEICGISAGFDTFVTAMSIAYGLMVSTLVLPRRFTSVTQTRVGRRTRPG
jgi:hypothetical protein